MPLRLTVGNLMVLVALVALCLATLRLDCFVGCFVLIMAWLAERITADEIRQRRARGERLGPVQIAGVWLASVGFLGMALLILLGTGLGVVIACYELIQAGNLPGVWIVLAGVTVAVWLVGRFVRRPC